MICNSVFYDRKTKPSAAYFFGVTFVYTIKSFKHSFLMGGVDTDAGVFYAKDSLFAVSVYRYGYTSVLNIVFDGIVAEIVYHFV